VVFFTPKGKTLLGAPPAQPGFGGLDGDPAPGESRRGDIENGLGRESGSGEAVGESFGLTLEIPAETGPHPTGAPAYKHDRHIPWKVEARAWEALESG
jgi:hypothetical protein